MNIRPLEIDRPAGGRLHPTPDFALDIRGRYWKTFVGAPGSHAKTFRRSANGAGSDRIGDGIEVRLDVHRAREVTDAWKTRESIANLIPLGVALGPKANDDTADDRPHIAHVEAREQGPDRTHERVRKPRAVAALEGQFAVVDDDG
jgi:hypothetical protein